MRVLFIFFFSSRRRHTRWPRDWSSDVCSSDLIRRNIDGPPLCSHLPFPQSSDVGMHMSAEVGRVCKIELREFVPHPVSVLPGRIVVSVEKWYASQDFMSLIQKSTPLTLSHYSRCLNAYP